MHGSALIAFGARFHAPQAFQIVKLEAGAFSSERSSKERELCISPAESLTLPPRISGGRHISYHLRKKLLLGTM